MITVPAPRSAHEPVGPGRVSWTTTGGTVQLAVVDPAQLRRAARIVSRGIAAVERACLLTDGELARVNRAGGRTLQVSPVLADVVAVALAVAERTGGDVDPVRPRTPTGPGERLSALPTCAAFPAPLHRADHHDIRLDGCRLTVPAGVRLDLRALAAAVAVDRCAAAVAGGLGTGALVGLAGVMATAGPAPAGGWQLPGLRLPAGWALSSSRDVELDPGPDPGPDHGPGTRPGTDPGEEPVWLSATVRAFSAVEAKAYGLAALARGTAAPRWLAGLGVPAVLVPRDGRPVQVGGWQQEVAS